METSVLIYNIHCTELYWCSSPTSPLLPTFLPAPLTRRYDSLDSATNGRSDIDSGSGSSQHTSRQYSLDSRHSLSDRWVSVPPLQLLLLSSSPAPACDSVSLWRQWWTCPVLLAHCACMHAILPCFCLFYSFMKNYWPCIYIYWKSPQICRSNDASYSSSLVLNLKALCVFFVCVNMWVNEWRGVCVRLCVVL